MRLRCRVTNFQIVSAYIDNTALIKSLLDIQSMVIYPVSLPVHPIAETRNSSARVSFEKTFLLKLDFHRDSPKLLVRILS
jgi:hypothetical protein